LKDPEVVAAITEARTQHRLEALGRMTNLRSQALDRLEGLVCDDDTSVVLRAVTLVLTTSTRFERDYELSERVAALESPSVSAASLPDSSGGTTSRGDR